VNIPDSYTFEIDMNLKQQDIY